MAAYRRLVWALDICYTVHRGCIWKLSSYTSQSNREIVAYQSKFRKKFKVEHVNFSNTIIDARYHE